MIILMGELRAETTNIDHESGLLGGGSINTLIDYNGCLPNVAKAVELMLDPDMLRQRAQLLYDNLEGLSVDSLVDGINTKNEGSASERSEKAQLLSNRLRNIFNMTDVNHDDKMTVGEFSICLKALSLDLSEPETMALFAQADTADLKYLTFSQFAYFFEKNLATIERLNHMKALYSTLHDPEKTIQAVGGEAEQMQQLKDLQEHLEFVFKSKDTAGTKKLNKDEIQTVLLQIDVELSPFQLNTIMSELFSDEEGLVEIDQAKTICAHLLQVFLSESEALSQEKLVEKEAISIVKNMEMEIHSIVNFFALGLHAIESGSVDIPIAESTRNIESLVYSVHSGLTPTEANHLMHTLFNEEYRKNKSSRPREENIIHAHNITSDHISKSARRSTVRKNSIMLSKASSDGALNSSGESNEQPQTRRRMSKLTISSRVSGTIIQTKKKSTKKGLYIPTAQELTNAIARAKKETIMRSQMQTISAESVTKMLKTAFTQAREVLVMQGQVQPTSTIVPVRTVFEVLEDCLHFRMGRSHIISLIIFSPCFDRTESMIDFVIFSEHAGSCIRDMHNHVEIEKRSQVIALITEEEEERKASAFSDTTFSDQRDGLLSAVDMPISESEMDAYLVEAFLAAEDNRGEVGTVDFISIMKNIPGVTLTTKDAITLGAGFPHTSEGAVRWQQFVPWAHKTVSTLLLEHMIRRRITLLNLDTVRTSIPGKTVKPHISMSTKQRNDRSAEESLGASNKEKEEINALKELIKLSDQALDLLKIRINMVMGEHPDEMIEQVICLFPFDHDDQLAKKKDEFEEEEDVPTLDAMANSQIVDGFASVEIYADTVLIDAVLVEPPARIKRTAQSSKHGQSFIGNAGNTGNTGNIEDDKRSSRTPSFNAGGTQTLQVKQSKPADGVKIPQVQVNVSVTAVESDLSLDRDLNLTVTGAYDYSKNKSGPNTDFEVDLVSPLAMPSMCLIDPESAIEFAASIPDRIVIEFTRGGSIQPRLVLKPSVLQ